MGEQEVKTLNGKKILVDKRFGRVTINHKARVTNADVKASNGVVHIIDTVLIPSTINGKPAVQLLNPCSLDDVPMNLQREYAFEFATLDKNNNGYLNPAEFKTKGQEMAEDFQKSSKNTNNGNSWLNRLRGGGRGRRLASWLDNLRKKFADQFKARQAARQAAAVFNKFDKDNSKQISLCEYENAMYEADKEAGNLDDIFNNNDGPAVVVHG